MHWSREHAGFDRQGRPINVGQWMTLHADLAYLHVRASAVCEDVHVSTVWTGFASGWDENRQPLIFETMVFGGPMDEYAWKWATEADAIIGHDAVVDAVRERINVEE